MNHSKYFDVNYSRLKQVVDMLFLTTKKEELDEEEIIKEAEKHDLNYEDIQELLHALVKENILINKGHKVYSKGKQSKNKDNKNTHNENKNSKNTHSKDTHTKGE